MGHPLLPILAVLLINVLVVVTVITYIDRIHKRTVAQIRNGLPDRTARRLKRIKELSESLEGNPPGHQENQECYDIVAMIEHCEPTVVRFDGELENIYVLVVHKGA